MRLSRRLSRLGRRHSSERSAARITRFETAATLRGLCCAQQRADERDERDACFLWLHAAVRMSMAPAQLDVMVAGWRCVQRRWRMPTVDNTAACSRRSNPPLPFSCRRAFTFQFPVSSFQFPVSTSQAQPHFHQVPVSSFQFPISSFQSLLSRIPNALSNSYVREASRAFKKVEIDRGAEGPISSFQNRRIAGLWGHDFPEHQFPLSRFPTLEQKERNLYFQFPVSRIAGR